MKLNRQSQAYTEIALEHDRADTPSHFFFCLLAGLQQSLETWDKWEWEREEGKRKGDILWVLVLSFHRVGSRDGTHSGLQAWE